MGVRERGAGWQADVIVAGRRERKDFRTREEAEAWEAETRERMEASRPAARRKPKPLPTPSGPRDGTRSETPIVTLRDAMSRTHERYYRGTTYEVKTWQVMCRVMADLGEERPIKGITTETLDDYVAELRAQGKAGSTINNRLSALSKTLRFAFERGHLPRMPKLEREETNNLRLRWLKESEELMLLGLFRQWGREDAAQVVEALIDTGMRPSELYALTPADVEVKADLSGGIIRIWQARLENREKVEKRTKNGDMRAIYMTRRVARIVAARVKLTAPDQPFLFPYDGFFLRGPWERARAVMKMAGDPEFVPYICRHTCAHRMVQTGVPVPVVQKWMGHKTIQVTTRYADVTPDKLEAVIAAMNDRAT